jgi:carbon-monoxide dehydrogenase small subunit
VSERAAGEAIELAFTLNGRAVSARVEARDLLLDVIRDRFGLTGAKRSCDVQVCGTCTVLVDGAPVSACTYLAYEVRGRRVETIEGLAKDGRLHPLQAAFVEHFGLQCGYCTPGMIMSAKALLADNPAPTREEIGEYLDGNLCRCTGYVKIVDAIEAAARSVAGEGDPALRAAGADDAALRAAGGGDPALPAAREHQLEERSQ